MRRWSRRRLSLLVLLAAVRCILPCENSTTNELGDLLCGYHEALRQDYMDSIRKQILKSLDYRGIPNITNRRPSRDELANVLLVTREEMLGDEPTRRRTAGASPGVAQVQTMLVFDAPAPKNLTEDHYRTFFDLRNESDSDYRVLNATLYFFVRRRPKQAEQSTEDYKFTVHIYKYISDREIKDEPIYEDHKKLNKVGEWMSVNITALVEKWIKTPNKNYGIMIRAKRETSAGPSELDLVFRLPQGVQNSTSEDQDTRHRMFLEIEVRDQTKTMMTEQSIPNDCTLEPPQYKNQCCRFPLQVDFESFGWDWIVAPKRYNAFYCAGHCPIGHEQSDPHPHILQQVRDIRNQERNISIGPCCSPKELLQMEVVFIDHTGNVRRRMIPNMIVQRCGCS